jgi:DNA-binding transcriptional LysR family regulator
MYLSQPGLSRQIAVMERELGIELFERGRNSVKLTEAGTICVDCLGRIRDEYQSMLHKITLTQHMQQDSLIIGGIEGQLIGECYENALIYFWSTRPNTKIKMCYFSVSDLCRALVEGEVDIAIMAEGDALRMPGVEYKRSRLEECCLVVPRNHPKADTENPTLQDFQDETFLVLAESDSDAIAGQHRKICQTAGFTPKQRIVPTFGTLAMLLEMGVGISVMNCWHSLRHAPHLKFLHVPNIGYQIEGFVWRKDNKNVNIPVLLSRIEVNASQDF